MAGPLARLYATLGLDARQFDSGLAGVKGRIDQLGGTAAVAGAAIGAGMGLAGAAALRLGTDYKDAMDTIRVGTGATGDTLKGLEAQFKAVGGRVPDDIAKVSAVIADLNTRTGQTGDGLGKLAEQIIDVSRLTGTEASDNVANFTRMFGDWSIATENQAESLDKLFRASQASGQGIDALSQQVVQFGAPLRNIGFEFEEAIALLAKWEKEGVNTTLSLGGLKIALGEFAKEGIDAKQGLEDLVNQIVNAKTATEAMALGVDKFGSRAGPDMVAAIREGRFATEDMIAVINDGTDTIAGLSDETRDAGDAFSEFKNQVQLSIGPIVKDLGGISDALGSAVFLLPAFGGVLGRGIGKALGGRGILDAAKAAGAKAGLAYAGAAGGAGMLGAITTIVAAMSPILIPVGLKLVGDALENATKGAIGGVGDFNAIAGSDGILKMGRDLKKLDEERVVLAREMAAAVGTEAFADLQKEYQDVAAAANKMQQEYKRATGVMEDGIIGVGDRLDGLARSTDDAVQSATSTLNTFASGIWSSLSGVVSGLDTGLPAAITADFKKARQAVLDGFGSIKAALKNPPQIISKADRIENMEARLKKVMKNLNKAVQADDPINTAYWSKAAAKQAVQIDKMRGKSTKTTGKIKQKFDAMGVDIDEAWKSTSESARTESQKAKTAAVNKAKQTVTQIEELDLTQGGINLMQSWADGIRLGASAAVAAATEAAGAVADVTSGNSPPPKGPLSHIDQGGANIMAAWAGGLRSGIGKVAGAANAAAGAFAPGLGTGPMMAAAGAGGGTHIHINGPVYGGPAGLRQLAGDIDRAQRPVSRQRRLDNLAEG